MLGWGLVYIQIGQMSWYTPPFRIESQVYDSKGWLKKMAKKLKIEAKKTEYKGEPTKKQLHELLDKAAQLFKESEKGKS